jgi:hypothetical protein
MINPCPVPRAGGAYRGRDRTPRPSLLEPIYAWCVGRTAARLLPVRATAIRLRRAGPVRSAGGRDA